MRRCLYQGLCKNTATPRKAREYFAFLICLGHEVSHDDAFGRVFRRPPEREASMTQGWQKGEHDEV